jgi:hypothetical protein
VKIRHQLGILGKTSGLSFLWIPINPPLEFVGDAYYWLLPSWFQLSPSLCGIGSYFPASGQTRAAFLKTLVETFGRGKELAVRVLGSDQGLGVLRDITSELPKKRLTGFSLAPPSFQRYRRFCLYLPSIIGSRKQHSLITLQPLSDRRWQRQQQPIQ